MGADIRYGLATKVDFSGEVKRVEIDEHKWIEADSCYYLYRCLCQMAQY